MQIPSALDLEKLVMGLGLDPHGNGARPGLNIIGEHPGRFNVSSNEFLKDTVFFVTSMSKSVIFNIDMSL